MIRRRFLLAGIVCLMLLTGFTAVAGGAWFTDSASLPLEISVNIPTPTPTPTPEWDKSSLEFAGQGIECAQDGPLVWADVVNTGEPMQQAAMWELWFAPDGNPKQGEVISGGQLPPLGAQEGLRLAALAARGTGNYTFKAYQHIEKPGFSELWSEAVAVIEDICPEQDSLDGNTELQVTPTASPSPEASSEPSAGDGTEAEDVPPELPTATPVETLTTTPPATPTPEDEQAPADEEIPTPEPLADDKGDISHSEDGETPPPDDGSDPQQDPTDDPQDTPPPEDDSSSGDSTDAPPTDDGT